MYPKSKIIMKSMVNLRKIVALACVLWVGATTALFAQPGGGTVNAALDNAATTVTSSFAPISKIFYAIMAVITILGAISVYSKWSGGDPDTRKAAASWFGALIFAGLVLVIIKAVFGVS